MVCVGFVFDDIGEMIGIFCGYCEFVIGGDVDYIIYC